MRHHFALLWGVHSCYSNYSGYPYEAWTWYNNESNVPNAQTWAVSGGSYDYAYKEAIQPRIKHFGAMGLEGEVEGEIRNGRIETDSFSRPATAQCCCTRCCI